MVYVTSSPACTVAGVAVLVRTRSASVTTSVSSTAVLLEGAGSGVVTPHGGRVADPAEERHVGPNGHGDDDGDMFPPTWTLPSEQDTVPDRLAARTGARRHRHEGGPGWQRVRHRHVTAPGTARGWWPRACRSGGCRRLLGSGYRPW